MPVDFQEYKGKRKRVNPQHKFPLLRLLLVALAAFLAYWSNVVQVIANALPLPGNEEAAVKSWEDYCRGVGGTAFSLDNGLAQCSWILNDSLESRILPNAFLRYVASLRTKEVASLHWIASAEEFSNPDFVLLEDSVRHEYVHMMNEDSSYVWISKENGCRFPGACPRLPMAWSALTISEGFDFEGLESLLAMDVFRGIGEAPIHPILSGAVVDVGKDSLGYYIEIDHGFNISSRTSGLGELNKSLSVGALVTADSAVGRLLPQDSAAFYLTVRQNGLFVRWEDFYAYSHPAAAKNIAAFEKSKGF